MLKTVTILLVLFFVLSENIMGQKVDSLKALLLQRGVDSSDVYREIAYEYIDLDNSLAFDFAEQAFSLAREQGDSLRMVKAGRVKASSLRRMEKIDQSILVSNEILSIARRNNFNEEIERLLNPLAVAYTLKGYYDKALKLHFESLKDLSSERNDDQKITLNNIGLVFFKLKNYNKALEFYNKSLALQNRSNDQSELDRILINIGLCYNELRQFEKAQKFIIDGLRSCGEKCRDRVVVEGTFGLGVAFFEMGEFENSKEKFSKSYEISKLINDKRFQAENLVYLARLAILKNDVKTAKQALSKSETLSLKSGYDEIRIQTYRQFSVLYLKVDDFYNTAIYQEKYIRLRDSIYSEELTQNLMALQAEYDQKENKAKLESQNKLLALNKDVINRQRWLNILAITTVLLLLALASALFKNNRQKKKTNLLLEQKVRERTKALEEIHQLVERSYIEQTNLLLKVYSDIKGPLTTMKGLCSLALPELSDKPSAKQYMLQLGTTTEQLSNIVNRLSQFHKLKQHY